MLIAGACLPWNPRLVNALVPIIFAITMAIPARVDILYDKFFCIYKKCSSVSALLTIAPVIFPADTALATDRIIAVLSPHAYTPSTVVL